MAAEVKEEAEDAMCEGGRWRGGRQVRASYLTYSISTPSWAQPVGVSVATDTI